MKDYANQVINRIQQTKRDDATGKSVIVGLSMGGIVAMYCARLASELIDAMVLMDTNPLSEVPSRRASRPSQIKRALEGELETILIEEMKPLYLAPQNRSNDRLLSLVLAMARDLGPDVFARQSTAIMNRHDNCEILSKWAKPTLLMHGEYDRLCPPEKHQFMHRLVPHSTLISIQNAGHLPTLEAPKLVNKHIMRFLSTLSDEPSDGFKQA